MMCIAYPLILPSVMGENSIMAAWNNMRHNRASHISIARVAMQFNLRLYRVKIFVEDI